MISKEAFEQFRTFVDSMEPPEYSEKQKIALNGETAMTQEIFDSCVKSCADEGNIKELFSLFLRFDDYGKVWCKGLEHDLSLMRKKGSRLSSETIQDHYNAFRESVRLIYGDEEADKLPVETPDKH